MSSSESVSSSSSSMPRPSSRSRPLYLSENVLIAQEVSDNVDQSVPQDVPYDNNNGERSELRPCIHMAGSENLELPPSLSTSTSSSRDSALVDFTALQEAITPSGLATIASRTRGCPRTHCTVDTSNVLYGSFNIVYIITFSDTPTKWIARIPLHGTKDSFHESDAKALEAQALTLRFIKQNTNEPVPEVVHYDVTFQNELGAPFIMMTWLDGKPVYEVWHDPTCDPDTLERRRENILKSTATAMTQLRFFSAPKLGELEFEQDSSTNKLRFNGIRNLHSLHLDEVSEDVMFSDLGPFDHTQDYFRSLARDSLSDRTFPDFALGQQKLLQIIIDAVPIVENERFVLTHPDYDVQNFLVNQEGYLTGILDWDGIAAYPRCLGYDRYPGWITRDWDPMAYGYGFEQPGMKKEDSPETLRKFRELYRRIIEEELGEEAANAMVNSHLYEAIDIAARNPMHSAAIVNLLVRRCIKEPLFEVLLEDDGTRVEEENGDQPDEDSTTGDTTEDDESQVHEDETDAASSVSVNQADDLHCLPGWVFDLYVALGEGRVNETQIEMLRQRFREVLTDTTHIVE